MKNWILESSSYQYRYPSIAGYGDTDFNEGPAVVFSEISTPLAFVDIEKSGNCTVTNSENSKEYNKTLSSYRMEDWFTNGVGRHPYISDMLGDFRLAAVISGFCRHDEQSDLARQRFEDKMEPFFPEEGRDVVLTSLSSLVARFASLANTRSVEVCLNAGRPSFPSSGLALDFHVAKDDALRGYYAMRDIGPLVVKPEAYDIHVFNRILADRLDGNTAENLEKSAYAMRQGTVSYWRGLGSYFPAVIAEPRRKANEFYLGMEMKAVGNELAHSHSPKFRERMKDRSETYYLPPYHPVLA